jgi:hypothetical protein
MAQAFVFMADGIGAPDLGQRFPSPIQPSQLRRPPTDLRQRGVS